MGILSHMRKTYNLDAYHFGLPLQSFPQSLRWYHSTAITPRRRPDFPSWSWTGWEGQALYSAPLDLTRERRVTQTNLTVRFLSIKDQILTVEAYVIRLDIRNIYLSEAYAPGSEQLVGILQENNDVGTKLAPSTYDFLIVERSQFRHTEEETWIEHVYMLLLEWNGSYARRKTKVRLFVEEDVNIVDAGATLRTLKLV
jgi:hypothetical protein